MKFIALLLLLLYWGDVGIVGAKKEDSKANENNQGSRCQLLINEVSSPFFNASFLEQPDLRAPSFIEFRFSPFCRPIDRVLPRKTVVSIITSLYTPKPTSLFYWNFDKRVLWDRLGNDIYTVVSSDFDVRSLPPGSVVHNVFVASNAVRGNAINTVSDTLHRQQTSVARSFGKISDRSKATLIIAVLDVEKKTSSSTFASFLKEFSYMKDDGKGHAIEKNKPDFDISPRYAKDLESMRNYKLDDYLVIPLDESAIYGRPAIDWFYTKERMKVVDATLLPVRNGFRTLPIGVSISRNPNTLEFAFTKESPGKANDLSSLMVDTQIFDLSVSAPVKNPFITTTTMQFDSILPELERRKDWIAGEAEVEDGDGGDDEDEGGDGADQIEKSPLRARSTDGEAVEDTAWDDLLNDDDEPRKGKTKKTTTNGVQKPVDHEDFENDIDVTERTTPSRSGTPRRGPSLFDDFDMGMEGISPRTSESFRRSESRIEGMGMEGTSPRTSGSPTDARKEVSNIAEDEEEDEPVQPVRKRARVDVPVTDRDLSAIEAAIIKAFRSHMPEFQNAMQQNQEELIEKIVEKIADRGLSFGLGPGETRDDRVTAVAKNAFDLERDGWKLKNTDRTMLGLKGYTKAEIDAVDKLQFITIVSRGQQYYIKCAICPPVRGPASKQFYSNSEGVEIPRKEDDKGFITRVKRHFEDPSHMRRVENKLEELKEKTKRYFDSLVPGNVGTFEATKNHFIAVLLENKLNLALVNHPAVLESLDRYGVPVGHLYRNNKMAAEMTLTISSTLNDPLIEHIRDGSFPFSLMMDSSTSASGDHYFIVLIRIPFELKPLNLYLQTFELKQSETGEYLFDTLKDYFTKNGLINAFWHRLISCASDGGSSLAKPGKGLNGRIREELEHHRPGLKAQFVWVHCGAHRLQLAFNDGLTGAHIPLLQRTDPIWKYRHFVTKALNRLKSFFGTIAHLRKQALHTVHDADETGDPFIKLKSIFVVRWCPSEYAAMESLLRMYRSVWQTLYNIATGGKSAQEKQVAASSLYMISDANFYGFMLWQAQLLQIMQKYSRILQTSSGTFHQFERVATELVDELNQLAAAPWDAPLIKYYLENKLACRELPTMRAKLGSSPACRSALFEGGHDAETHLIYLRKPPKSKDADELVFRGPNDDEQHQANKDKRNAETRSIVRAAQQALDALNRKTHDDDEDLFSDSEDAKKMQEASTRRDLRTFLTYKDARFTPMTRAKRLTLIASLSRHLKDRFDTSGTLLAKMKTLAPSALMDLSLAGFRSGPNIADRKLVYEYLRLDGGPLEKEFNSLQKKMETLTTEEKDALKELVKQPEEWYSALCARIVCSEAMKSLFSAIIVISPSTAEVERSFSTLFWVKDSRSSSLKVEGLDARMRLQLNSPPVSEWSPDQAIRRWQRTGHSLVDADIRTRGKDKNPRKTKAGVPRQEKEPETEQRSSILGRFHAMLN